jgi:hypothetical protein
LKILMSANEIESGILKVYFNEESPKYTGIYR